MEIDPLVQESSEVVEGRTTESGKDEHAEKPPHTPRSRPRVTSKRIKVKAVNYAGRKLSDSLSSSALKRLRTSLAQDVLLEETNAAAQPVEVKGSAKGGEAKKTKAISKVSKARKPADRETDQVKALPQTSRPKTSGRRTSSPKVSTSRTKRAPTKVRFCRSKDVTTTETADVLGGSRTLAAIQATSKNMTAAEKQQFLSDVQKVLTAEAQTASSGSVFEALPSNMTLSDALQLKTSETTKATSKTTSKATTKQRSKQTQPLEATKSGHIQAVESQSLCMIRM